MKTSVLMLKLGLDSMLAVIVLGSVTMTSRKFGLFWCLQSLISEPIGLADTPIADFVVSMVAMRLRVLRDNRTPAAQGTMSS